MPKTIKQKVDEINEVAFYCCNDWELGFLASVTEKLEKGFVMSEKQVATIEKLYDKACALDESHHS